MMVDQAEDAIIRLRAVADDLERYLDSFPPPPPSSPGGAGALSVSASSASARSLIFAQPIRAKQLFLRDVQPAGEGFVHRRLPVRLRHAPTRGRTGWEHPKLPARTRPGSEAWCCRLVVSVRRATASPNVCATFRSGHWMPFSWRDAWYDGERLPASSVPAFCAMVGGMPIRIITEQLFGCNPFPGMVRKSGS